MVVTIIGTILYGTIFITVYAVFLHSYRDYSSIVAYGRFKRLYPIFLVFHLISAWTFLHSTVTMFRETSGLGAYAEQYGLEAFLLTLGSVIILLCYVGISVILRDEVTR